MDAVRIESNAPVIVREEVEEDRFDDSFLKLSETISDKSSDRK